MDGLSRVLIWGKTYPELSESHRETVCTGGCLEDGTPVRLFPVPLRLLPEQSRYQLWDWVEVQLATTRGDNRPESRKVTTDHFKRIGKVSTENGWELRRKVIFSRTHWHFSCVRHLWEAQAASGTSLGMVKVGEVLSVGLEKRSDEEERKHEKKLRRLQAQRDLFSSPQQDLEFIPYRVMVRWRCEDLEECPGHRAGVLDWGLAQLGRKAGPETAKKRVEDLADLQEHDLHFFMGNFFLHQQSFGIIGMWYPKKKHMGQTEIFTPLETGLPRPGPGG